MSVCLLMQLTTRAQNIENLPNGRQFCEKCKVLRFFQKFDFSVIFLLAVMSNSRSDVVTQSVRLFVFPSVRPLFFLLVSLKFLLVLKSFNEVSRQFKGCLKFQGCFKEVIRVLTENLKGVSRKFRGCFK